MPGFIEIDRRHIVQTVKREHVGVIEPRFRFRVLVQRLRVDVEGGVDVPGEQYRTPGVGSLDPLGEDVNWCRQRQ